MKVEFVQFSLQAFYERLVTEEIPDNAVRERIAVQLQISCTHTNTHISVAQHDIIFSMVYMQSVIIMG